MRKFVHRAKEPPSTYTVQNRTQEEILRLEIQDKMMTIEMGGVLPELDDPNCMGDQRGHISGAQTEVKRSNPLPSVHV
jgi:hypothetical protein